MKQWQAFFIANVAVSAGCFARGLLLYASGTAMAGRLFSEEFESVYRGFLSGTITMRSVRGDSESLAEYGHTIMKRRSHVYLLI
jgi:hypothetical protein